MISPNKSNSNAFRIFFRILCVFKTGVPNLVFVNACYLFCQLSNFFTVRKHF
nr:MAG TPA: hypothetical protein [Caudoviricetes sp.]